MPKHLSRYHRFLGYCLRHLYFSRITVTGEPVSQAPTLFIASHRNGATDGLVYAAALADTPSLVSIQLLRNRLLRLLFDGIPVVRGKDRRRYGIKRSAVASPVDACVRQIRQGGRVCIMPEGTSEWQVKPLTYKRGMAHIVRRLRQEGSDFVVQPLGIFYTRPDGFRSTVSVVVGKAFTLKESGENELDAIQTVLRKALDEVSVNCQSAADFNAVQYHAWQEQKTGADFGLSFLQHQEKIRQKKLPRQERHSSTASPLRLWIIRVCAVGFAIGFPAVVLSARLALLASDGVNNRSFFKIMGGIVGVTVHLPMLVVLLVQHPLPAILWTAIGLISFLFYPEPEPFAMEETGE